ncbi:MAG: hypothetical protein Q9222_002397 [Ikaeria aurantiellina]
MEDRDIEAALSRTLSDGNDAIVGDSQPVEPRAVELHPRGRGQASPDQLHKITEKLIEGMRGYLDLVFQRILSDLDQSVELSSLPSVREPAVAGANEISTERPELGHDNRPDSDQTPMLTNSPSPHAAMLGAGESVDSGANGTVGRNARHHSDNVDPQQQNQTATIAPVFERTVEVMSDIQIQEQNKDRRSNRRIWKGEENLEYLEDPWKELWAKDRHDADRPFFQCSDEGRKNIQLELVDALMFAPIEKKIDLLCQRDFRLVSCWISLIGLRLSDLYGPVLRNLETAQLSDAMCPALKQIRCPELDRTEDLSEAWLKPISQAEEEMRQDDRDIEFALGKEPFLAVRDLNVKDLQTIGRLRIEWTSHWDEHLKLRTEGPANVLTLYWFSPSLADLFLEMWVLLFPTFSKKTAHLINRASHSGLCGRAQEHDIEQRAHEIYDTNELLFVSGVDKKRAKKRHDSLKAPTWLSLLAHPELKTWKKEYDIDQSADLARPLSHFHLNQKSERLRRTSFCYDMIDHIVTPWESGRNLERITYSEFPCHYRRLRILRYYMDAQQPNGWRGLWRDKRDSSTYYTFWLVILFGGAGVVLGFLTLAVAIVQAWAQVRTVH